LSKNPRRGERRDWRRDWRGIGEEIEGKEGEQQQQPMDTLGQSTSMISSRDHHHFLDMCFINHLGLSKRKPHEAKPACGSEGSLDQQPSAMEALKSQSKGSSQSYGSFLRSCILKPWILEPKPHLVERALTLVILSLASHLSYPSNVKHMHRSQPNTLSLESQDLPWT
jgi:hypothetical protein